MRLNEAFISIQGEGPQMGVRSLFIRLSGCNLKCPFCDTKYANLSIMTTPKELVRLINRAYDQGVHNVIWTGGEPALQISKIREVVAASRSYHRVITHAIETNGTIPFGSNGFDLIVVSPKDEVMVGDSLTNTLDYWTTHWNDNVVLKPVVSEFNVDWWMNWASDHPNVRIYFMPLTPQDEMMIPEHNRMVKMIIRKMDEHKVNGAVSPRLHVLYKVR